MASSFVSDVADVVEIERIGPAEASMCHRFRVHGRGRCGSGMSRVNRDAIGRVVDWCARAVVGVGHVVLMLSVALE
jgi:hypothetical protein